VSDLMPSDARVHYLRLNHKLSLGAKRNLACREAHGDIIVHWDDDDWMAHWRLNYQVESLLKNQADICGLNQLLYYDIASGQAWQYSYSGGKPWVSGNTLCYTKHVWQANPFPEINIGEDTRFIWTNRPKKVIALPDHNFYVALIHSKNTSPKRPRGAWWRSHSNAEVRQLLGDDFAFYGQRLQRSPTSY